MKKRIQEQIIRLRELQANCPASERAAIQREIERLYKILDSL